MSEVLITLRGVEITYTCTRCREVKGDEGFYWRKNEDTRGHRSPLRQPCKTCCAARDAAHRNEDPGARRATLAKSYMKHRDRLRAAGRSRLLGTYGLTVAEYEQIHGLQEGRCAICLREETVTDPRYGQVRRLAVDHCHETGVVRGLLCARCNMAMGMFEDDLGRLIAVVSYLQSHQPARHEGAP